MLKNKKKKKNVKETKKQKKQKKKKKWLPSFQLIKTIMTPRSAHQKSQSPPAPLFYQPSGRLTVPNIQITMSKLYDIQIF